LYLLRFPAFPVLYTFLKNNYVSLHSISQFRQAKCSGLVKLSWFNDNIPYNLQKQPNKETMAAMLEAERIARDPSVKRYSDV